MSLTQLPLFIISHSGNLGVWRNSFF